MIKGRFKLIDGLIGVGLAAALYVTVAFAADYVADQSINTLADVGASITRSTRILGQDMTDTDKTGVVDPVDIFGLLEAGDIPDISATYESADAAITKSDEAETLTANWVNTANPWADNEVADDITITAGSQVQGGNPAFTTVEVGHATDTTLSRASAGDVNIEGNIVYRAGGTDVPDADVADDITLTNISQITTKPITSLSATNWRLFYSGAGSIPIELALGANGTYLKSNGASSAPTWDTPAGGGSGDVESVGDCLTGACLDGTSDGGTYIRLYDGDSNYTQFAPGNSAADLTYTFPTAYPAGNNYLMQMSTAGAISTTNTLNDVTFGGFTANRALETDGSGNLEVSLVTDTELNYLDGIGGFAKDLVTTSPVTGATNDVLVGADGDVTIALDFTAAWDFGGVADFEIWNSTSDMTLDTAGQIGLQLTDDQLVFHGGAAGEAQGEAALSLLQHVVLTFDPAWAYDQESTYRTLPIMWIGDDAPEGITITEWRINYVGGDPTTELDADIMCDTTPDFNPAANATVMDVIDTTAGAANADTGFDSATCANGSRMYIRFGADPTDANVMVSLDIWYYAEED